MSPCIAEALQWVSDPDGLDEAACRAVIELLLSGSPSEEQGAELLRRWAGRGETATEIAALVRLLRERCRRVPVSRPGLDLCGTGGSGLTRYNVSTTAAVLLAAAGVPVAKHGNRGSRRANGSFDLLEALGLPLDLEPEALASLYEQTGLCFCFARAHHPAVAAAVPYRKAAGGRSIFNLAGPLANPAELSCQVVGVLDQRTAERIAGALLELGVQRAVVVWGHPGIDELSVVGPSDWLHLEDGVRVSGGCPGGLYPGLNHADLPGGDAECNAGLFTALLDGTESGPLRDLVCINAGLAIDLWHARTPALQGPGYREALELLASGKARTTWQNHLAAAQACAAGPH